MLWARTDATGTMALFSSGDARPGKSFNLKVVRGRFGFMGFARDIFDKGPEVVDGNWHHFAVTFDGTTVKLFLDGAQIAQDQRSLSTGSSMGWLGRSNHEGVFEDRWNGDLRDLRVYEVALPDEQLRAVCDEQLRAMYEAPAAADDQAQSVKAAADEQVVGAVDEDSQSLSATSMLPASDSSEPAASSATAPAPRPPRELPARRVPLWQVSSEDSALLRTFWEVDARKLTSSHKEAVSPPFDLPFELCPAREGQFKMYIRPTAVHAQRGGASFGRANGKGGVFLRCLDSAEKELDLALTFQISVGLQLKDGDPPRGPIRHDFSRRATCGLPEAKGEWEFKKYVDKETQMFVVCLEVIRGDAPAKGQDRVVHAEEV